MKKLLVGLALVSFVLVSTVGVHAAVLPQQEKAKKEVKKAKKAKKSCCSDKAAKKACATKKKCGDSKKADKKKEKSGK